jgi:hypothetical protein
MLRYNLSDKQHALAFLSDVRMTGSTVEAKVIALHKLSASTEQILQTMVHAFAQYRTAAHTVLDSPQDVSGQQALENSNKRRKLGGAELN